MVNDIAKNAGFYIAVRAVLWAVAGWLISWALQKGIFPKELVDTVSATVSQEQWEAIVLGITGVIVAAGNTLWVRMTNKDTVRVPVAVVEHANDPTTPQPAIPVVDPGSGKISVPVTTAPVNQGAAAP